MTKRYPPGWGRIAYKNSKRRLGVSGAWHGRVLTCRQLAGDPAAIKVGCVTPADDPVTASDGESGVEVTFGCVLRAASSGRRSRVEIDHPREQACCRQADAHDRQLLAGCGPSSGTVTMHTASRGRPSTQ